MFFWVEIPIKGRNVQIYVLCNHLMCSRIDHSISMIVAVIPSPV